MRKSPLQNRVTPFGEIIATPERGTLMGNRGIIHNPDTKQLLTRRWQHHAWICCVLEFKGFQHPIMGAGAYTELFFLDEVTALAAGHRPCAYCRRVAFNAFKQAWCSAADINDVRAPEIDRQLHRERVTRDRKKVTFVAPLAELPDGTMIELDGNAHMLKENHLFPWHASGYGEPVPAKMSAQLPVLTPYRRSSRLLKPSRRLKIRARVMPRSTVLRSRQ